MKKKKEILYYLPFALLLLAELIIHWKINLNVVGGDDTVFLAYSQEEGTPAGEREDQIEEEIKEQRLDGIMRRQIDISLAANREMIGHVYQVMVDGRDEDGSYLGRTRYDAPEIDNAVIFTSQRTLQPGDLVNVRIEDAFDYDIVGREVQRS